MFNFFSSLIVMALLAPEIKVPQRPMSHPLNPILGDNETLKRTHVKLLVYNLFLRPPGIADDHHDDYKNERLNDFLTIIQDYDIICLEEVFGLLNNRKKKIIEHAKKAGFSYYVDSPQPDYKSGFLVGGGLLIISRFPIVASEFMPYTRGNNEDFVVLKGVLYAQIQISSQRLHLSHGAQA